MDANLKIKTEYSDAIEQKKLFESLMQDFNDLATESFKQGFQFITIDGNFDPATNTGDCRVILEPTDKLLLFISALRAFNVNTRGLVDFPCSHSVSPSVVVKL